MVDLKKRVAKVESTTDTEFEAFIAEMDEFIQEMHEENRLYAEIRTLRRQNKKLVEENQALKNEIRQKSNDDKIKVTSSDEDNESFHRSLKQTRFLINTSVGLVILFDIFIYIYIFIR